MQLHLYGYVAGEVTLPALTNEVRPGGRVVVHPLPARNRRPVSVSLPFFIEGAVMPTPDMKDMSTTVLGIMKRIINPLPKQMSVDRMRQFEGFVLKWIHDNLVPLPADSDTSVARWLEKATYPEWRKQELRDTEVCSWDISTELFETKSFIKYETYGEYKHARTINPRPDEFKVFSGPIFKLIEEQVFSLPYFIKKIPYQERATYIMDNVYVEGSEYFVTDYTSFESSFTPEFMRACEMQLYKYMTSGLEGGRYWYETVEKALCGQQKLRFGNVTAFTEGTRMSGDMCTSLGNGFSNLMLMLFAGEVHELGEMRAVFEGDDGLGCFKNGVPPAEFFLELGFRVKMEVVPDLFSASFCGMVFDPESKQNMSDPYDFLASVGWTSSQYLGAREPKLMGLLKAKAMSGMYEWRGSPVIPHLCKRLIWLTRKYDWRVVLKSKSTSQYLRERYMEMADSDLPFEEPTQATRILFETRYKIPVDMQLLLENKFSTIELGPCPLPHVQFPTVYEENWANYVCSTSWIRASAYALERTAPRFHPTVIALLYAQSDAMTSQIKDLRKRAKVVRKEHARIEKLIRDLS